jgi:hypothetical protein
MSFQKSLLENALKKATKEAEKLKINDTPQPIDRDEAKRHQNLVDLVNEKRQRVLEVTDSTREIIKSDTHLAIFSISYKNRQKKAMFIVN